MKIASTSQRSAARNPPARERLMFCIPRPASPTNRKTPAANRACPSATPAAAAATAAVKDMDARKPFTILRFTILPVAHFRLSDLRLSAFVSSGSVSSTSRNAEACKSRNSVSPGSYLANFTRSQLSRNRRDFPSVPAAANPFRRSSRRNSSVVRSGARKLKPFFQISADRVGNRDANGFGCEISASASSSFCFARMCAGTGGSTGTFACRFCHHFQSANKTAAAGQHAERDPKPFPAVRNFHRRLDVADVVSHRRRALS